MINKFKVWQKDEKRFLTDEEIKFFTLDDMKYDDPHLFIQFTGMNDSAIDGEEIYTGDIIENCDTKSLQIVYWNYDKCAWYCYYVGDENRIVSLSDSIGNLNKKVGNIFENPNLLQ